MRARSHDTRASFAEREAHSLRLRAAADHGEWARNGNRRIADVWDAEAARHRGGARQARRASRLRWALALGAIALVAFLAFHG